MLMIIAAALTAVQPTPARPVPVEVRIADTGSARDRGGLEQLLFQVWNRRGDIRATRQTSGAWSACVSRGARVEINVACVQAQLPAGRDGRGTVGLFIISDPVNGPALHCVGRSRAGRAYVSNMGRIWEPGVTRRAKNNDRVAVANCINSAAPGAVSGELW